MSRYAVETGVRDGNDIVVLRDTASGARAELWPGCGNNCFSVALAPPGETGTGLVHVVSAPPALDELRRRPSFWGIPLLFPFAGRLPDGAYQFEGQQRRFGVPDGAAQDPPPPREEHGFAMGLPWTVVAVDADDERAQIHSTLTSADHPQTLDGYPFPYRVEALYRLDARGLQLRLRVTNVGASPLPFGCGFHPYIHLPLGPRGAPDACLVHIPAARRWDWLGLRERADRDSAAWDLSWEDACPPVDRASDLRVPRPFGERIMPGAYTDLTLVEDHVEALVRDPANGLEVVMRASPAFANVIFWSPPGRPELCLEPWTSPPFGFILAAHAVPRHGIVVLAPGQQWHGSMRLALRRPSRPSGHPESAGGHATAATAATE